MATTSAPRITLFQCTAAPGAACSKTLPVADNLELHALELPCSSMVRDVFLLRAFEAGADAVVVFTCPEGQCRHIDGNIRARKRVERVQGILDEIGLNGRRLSLFNIAPGDVEAVSLALRKVLSDLAVLGPNPAAPERTGVLAASLNTATPA